MQKNCGHKYRGFLYPVTEFFDQKELQITCVFRFSIRLEQFSFNGKNVQSVHVKGEECFVTRDVYIAFGYERENGKKAIQNLVSSKYKLRFGEVKPSLNQGKIFSRCTRIQFY